MYDLLLARLDDKCVTPGVCCNASYESHGGGERVISIDVVQSFGIGAGKLYCGKYGDKGITYCSEPRLMTWCRAMAMTVGQASQAGAAVLRKCDSLETVLQGLLGSATGL